VDSVDDEKSTVAHRIHSPYDGIVFPSRSSISFKKKGGKSILELAHLVPW
jgi:hypothetical protein